MARCEGSRRTRPYLDGTSAALARDGQRNAALVEQSAAAAESLKRQAHKLREAVAVFRLGAGEGRTFTAA